MPIVAKFRKLVERSADEVPNYVHLTLRHFIPFPALRFLILLFLMLMRHHSGDAEEKSEHFGRTYRWGKQTIVDCREIESGRDYFR